MYKLYIYKNHTFENVYLYGRLKSFTYQTKTLPKLNIFTDVQYFGYKFDKSENCFYILYSQGFAMRTNGSQVYIKFINYNYLL